MEWRCPCNMRVWCVTCDVVGCDVTSFWSHLCGDGEIHSVDRVKGNADTPTVWAFYARPQHAANQITHYTVVSGRVLLPCFVRHILVVRAVALGIFSVRLDMHAIHVLVKSVDHRIHDFVYVLYGGGQGLGQGDRGRD